VDDHPIVRQGLRQLIGQQPDLVVCADASDSREALEAIRASPPDAAIIDLTLEDDSGLGLIKDIKARHPDVAILVLSMHDEVLFAERALRAGASGYIMKQETLEETVKALRRVLAGSHYVSDKMTSRLLQRCVGGLSLPTASLVECLTDRELEVFELMGRGKSTREIAKGLHLSRKTIETHQAHIKEKLGLENHIDLLRRAVSWQANEGRS
jgi:DNA-binding NarL/FixJ family response regulator